MGIFPAVETSAEAGGIIEKFAVGKGGIGADAEDSSAPQRGGITAEDAVIEIGIGFPNGNSAAGIGSCGGIGNAAEFHNAVIIGIAVKIDSFPGGGAGMQVEDDAVGGSTGSGQEAVNKEASTLVEGEISPRGDSQRGGVRHGNIAYDMVIAGT